MILREVLELPNKEILIYGLCDPDSKEIKYIGLSTTGFDRIKDHYYTPKEGTNSLTNVKRWIKQLKKQNKIYDVIYLEEFDNDGIHLDEAEQFWISYFKFLGADLLNHENGGRHNINRFDPIFKKQRSDDMKKINGTEEKRQYFSKKTKEFWSKKETRLKLLQNRPHANSLYMKIIDRNDNEYRTVKEASKATGISPTTINRILKGEKSEYKGYIFKYRKIK